MRFCVLGPLLVATDDDPLIVPGAKERLLLAVLTAASPGVVSVDRLIDVLWDGDPPPTAHKSLQAHVVRLRSALEPGRPKGSSGRYVVRRGAGYALAVGRDEIDALALGDQAARGRALLSSGDAPGAERALAVALELWRGEPYADWPDVPFAETERRRLVEVRAGAVAALLEARLALGRQAEVLPELERLVAQEPLREGWWSLLMLALYRDGRQADALAAGRRVRALLAEEVGADPGPALRRVETAILEHDPALDLAPARLPLQREVSGPAAAPPPPSTPAPMGACPYMGLAAYQREDAPLFRGRQRVLASLLRSLVDAPVLVVSGPSGAGKSSLVRAGLLPALATGALPGSGGWRPVILTPGRNAVDGLAGLTGESPPEAPVVLVADQFEELWAPGVEPAERTAFLDAVLGLIDDGILIRCVAVVRGDHVGRLAEHAAFTERLGGTLVLVPPLTDPELREVVTEPARTTGLSVESELLDAVVTDVVGQPGALPLLSTALVGTWERRRGTVLTLAGYLEAGGVAGALTRSAEAAYAALDEPGRELARRILVRLADSDEPGVLVRRRVPLRELDLTGDGGAARREVVEQFVRRRLLAVDEDRLEVAHEALLTAWPRLARWLEDDAAGRTVRRHLAPAALEWDEGGRPEEELYRGARLSAALDWAADPDADPTPVERDFIDASGARADAELRAARERAQREARGRRRTVRLAAGLAAVLALALVAAGLAITFQRDADERALDADANRLAALSTTVRPLDLSLLLAAQAVRLAQTPETEDGLLAALIEHRRAIDVAAVGRRPADLALDGTGTRLFMSDSGGSARVVSWPVGEPTRAQTVVAGWPDILEASPTGDLMATAFVAGDARVDLFAADGTPQRTIHEGDLRGWPADVAFSPDGRELLVAVLNIETGLTVRRQDVGGGEWTTTDAGVEPYEPGTEYGASLADDAAHAVYWTHESPYRAHLVDLAQGSRTPLQPVARDSQNQAIIALRTGIAQLWADGGVTLYDWSGRPVQTLDAHQGAVRDVLVAPTGDWAATAGNDATIVLWDVDPENGHWSRRETLTGHSGEIAAMELDPSGRRLYSVATDGRLITWDVTADAGFGSSYPGLGARYIANEPKLVGHDNLMVAATRPLSMIRRGRGMEDYLALDTENLAVTFFDPTTGRVVDEVPLGNAYHGVYYGVVGAASAVSPDGRLVVVTSPLAATVLDTDTREVLATFSLPSLGGSGPDGQAEPEVIFTAEWTPRGDRLLLGVDGAPGPGDGGLVVIDPAGWREERRVFLPASVQAIETSPDGRLLAVGTSERPEAWILSAATFETVQTLSLPEEEQVHDLAFSTDGRWLAAGGDARVVSVFDTDTWELLHEPVQVDTQFIQDLEFLPDGRTLLAAGFSGEVALYDVIRGVIRGRPLPSSTRPGVGYTHLIPGPTDALVVLGGARDGHRYPMRPALWLAEACTIVGERDLSEEEWSRYLPGRAYQPTCSDLP